MSFRAGCKILLSSLSRLVPTSNVPASGWVKVGHAYANSEGQTEEVNFGGREFHRVKLVVKDASVRFHDVLVQFRNGEERKLSAVDFIPAGCETRPLDLPAADRRIEKLILRCETPNSLQGAAIEVWATAAGTQADLRAASGRAA